MLTSDDRALLREVFTWARANGWRPIVTDRESREWTRIDDLDAPNVNLVRRDFGGGYDLRVYEYAEPSRCRTFVESTTVCRAIDVLSALDVLPAEFSTNYKAGHANGHEQAYYASKTQWGIRRAGFKTVRITSDTNARSLLRNFVVPAEMVMREVGPWEVVATNDDRLARGER